MTFLELSFIGVVAVLAVRWAIRRSLAPTRVTEQLTPRTHGLTYQEVRIPTENGKFLYGWFVPAERAGPGPAVAGIHGWGGNAETLLPLVRPLHEAGISVLLIDARCHGQSDEDSFASLPRFAEDLSHAIDWLQRRPEIDPLDIAVIGHSVGAGAALLCAARRGDLVAVVSLAAFTHPVAMMQRWMRMKRIPYPIVGWLILRYVEWVIGHHFDDIAPVNTIRRVSCPVLLVHGTEDDTVPVNDAEMIYRARSGEHVTLKLVAGSHDEYADLERELPALVAYLEVVFFPPGGQVTAPAGATAPSSGVTAAANAE